MTRSRRPRAEGPQPVGELLSRVLGRRGLAARVEAASVVPDWPRLVGPGIAGVTEPLRVSEGTLFVAVASSAWIMELNMMKSEILARLNAGKRQGRLKGIVFVMAEGRGGREEGRGTREEKGEKGGGAR